MEDVAREAGVARMTVYRHFASRDDLMQALIDREIELYFAEVSAMGRCIEAATEAGTNPALAVLVKCFQFTMHHFRDHPILSALLEREPHLLAPYVTSNADSMFRAAVSVISPGLDRWMAEGWIRPLPSAEAAEWLVRLAVSWQITRGAVTIPDDEGVMARLVHDYVWPVLDPRPHA